MELTNLSYSHKLNPLELFEISGGCVVPMPEPELFPCAIIIAPKFDDFPKPYDIRPLLNMTSIFREKLGMLSSEVTYN